MSTQTTQTDSSTGFQAIIQADVFEQFIANATAVADEARVHCEADGLRLCVVDPANVAMIEQTLAAEAFESYESGELTLGANLGRLAEVVGLAEDGELLRLVSDGGTLSLSLSELDATVAGIDTDSIRAEPDMPDLVDDLPATVALEGRALDRIATATGLVGDRVRFRAEDDLFVAEGEGDTDEVRVEFAEDDVESLVLSGDADSLVSLDYVEDVIGPIGASTVATVQVGGEMPVVIKHGYAEGAGQVTAMIAPRVASD
jgi:proliferating cell nuclear antigen